MSFSTLALSVQERVSLQRSIQLLASLSLLCKLGLTIKADHIRPRSGLGTYLCCALP